MKKHPWLLELPCGIDFRLTESINRRLRRQRLLAELRILYTHPLVAIFYALALVNLGFALAILLKVLR